MQISRIPFVKESASDTSPELSVKSLVRSKVLPYRKWMIAALVVAIIWDLLVLIFFIRVGFSGVENIEGFIYGLLAPWIFLGLVYGHFHLKARKAFWQQIASENGWEYLSTIPTTDLLGVLFRRGHSQSAQNVISGTYQGFSFRLFEYYYKTGYGKHQTTHQYVAYQIFSTGRFPHLYLDYLGDNGLLKNFNFAMRSVSLPETANKEFRLYAPREYETEALELFSLPVLDRLSQSNIRYDVEFIENQIVVYHTHPIRTAAVLYEELQSLEQFIDLFGPRIHNFSFEKIGDLSPRL